MRPVLNLNGLVSLMSHLSLFLAMIVLMMTMMTIYMMMMKMLMSIPALKEGYLLARVKVEIASTVRSLYRPLQSNHP